MTQPTKLERIFSLFSHYIGLKFPQGAEKNADTATLTDLYAGQMFAHGNFFHRQIFGRMAPHIRIDQTHLESIKSKAALGPFVYITIDLGQLEYNIFNTVALTQGLPLAQFNNAFRNRRWRPLSWIRKNFHDRIEWIKKEGDLPHPLHSGYLKNLILENKSLFLSLDALDPVHISMPMRDIFNALLEVQKTSEKPVFIVPEQLIWDKRPKREKALEYPGRWHKIFLFWRHYKKRAIVRLAEPISLKEFAERPSAEAPARLYEKILGSLKFEKRTLTGPPIRPRSWFLDRIFEDESLAHVLYEVAKEKNRPVPSVKRLAHKYAKEIAADVHYSNLEWGLHLIDWIFKTLFEGVLIDEEGLKNLKKTLGKGPTVLVSNHRSHFDYLLLAHLCYTNDIVVPLVAAGVNLTFWPLGFYFRRCGAFFLRRTFAGNTLYKKVFQTYLKVLIQEGYPQEFFIEGGRSRTGKLRSPKLGMLSMYSQVMQEGAAEDIQFVPVSITYDRVLEQKSYLGEVEGKPKEKEKTRDLLKLGKFLRGRYGKVYVHFDEPVSWHQAAQDIHEPDWEKKKPKVVEALSQKICHAINRQVVVIPQSLSASALLLNPRRGVMIEKVEADYRELLHYLQWKQVKLSETLSKNPEGSLMEALHQFESSGLIKRYQGLEQIFYEIPQEKRLELDFFKNASIHYFVSLSLWSNLLLTRKTQHGVVEHLIKEYAYFQQLFLYEFRFSTRRTLTEHIDKLCCYLQERKLIEYHNGEIEVIKEGRPLLKNFGLLIRNFVEAYWVAWKTYLLRPIHPDDEKTLTKAIMTHAKHQLMLGVIRHPEAISQTIFENAIQSFKMLGLFNSETDAAKKLEMELEKLLEVD